MTNIEGITALVVPDIHLNFKKAQAIIDHYDSKVDRIILLGDYFDNFRDTPELNGECANWLRELLANGRVVALVGNHDVGYLQPKIASFQLCPGYSPEKHRQIASHLPESWLPRFDLAVSINGWLLSHAGVHRYYLSGDTTTLEGQIDLATENLLSGRFHPLFYAGYRMTGERLPPGGILWQDWDHEFRGLPEVPQIIGHSPAPEHRIFDDGYAAIGVCLDTNLMTHGVISRDGALTIFSDTFARLETIAAERVFG